MVQVVDDDTRHLRARRLQQAAHGAVEHEALALPFAAKRVAEFWQQARDLAGDRRCSKRGVTVS